MNMKNLQVLAVGAVLVAGSSFAGDAHKGHADHKDMISAGKLARDAKDFYGKTVTVKAEVEDVFGDKTFTLDEDSVLAGADVLVLVPGGMTAALTTDQKVVVTGTVRPFVVAELDRDFDFFQGGKIIKTEKKVDFEQRPVIVATTVTTESGKSLLVVNK
jgi:hypothetical protein